MGSCVPWLFRPSSMAVPVEHRALACWAPFVAVAAALSTGRSYPFPVHAGIVRHARQPWQGSHLYPLRT